MATVSCARRVKNYSNLSLIVLAFLALSAILGPASSARVAAPTVRTIAFSNGSSTLTPSAKRLLVQWKTPLKGAAKITVTGFAPSVRSLTRQRKLATSRAFAVASELKRLGITAIVTKKVSLLSTSASRKINGNKATIVVTSLKPSATPSSSASPTPSSSPSSTPSSPTASTFKFSGTFTLDFVDCNEFQKQVTATSMTLTSSSNGVEPIVIDLAESNTSHEANNLMNCSFSWANLAIEAGTYAVSIQAKCTDILDSDISDSTACTPGNYRRQDSQSQSTASLVGSGPTGQPGSYTMSIDLPEQIVVTHDKYVNYEAWLD